jgi:hypothetical protein
MSKRDRYSPPCEGRKCVRLTDGKICRVSNDEADEIVRRSAGQYCPKQAFKAAIRRLVSR